MIHKLCEANKFLDFVNCVRLCGVLMSSCCCVMYLFYDFIQELAKTARKRVVLASLYLGTGPLEKDLVSIFISRAGLRFLWSLGSTRGPFHRMPSLSLIVLVHHTYL